jgi:hypothetical protein
MPPSSQSSAQLPLVQSPVQVALTQSTWQSRQS